jgi:hypothetical protein
MSDDNTFIKKYCDLFVGRSDVYAIQQPNGSYDSVKLQLEPNDFFGGNTIGLYQLDTDNNVKWAVLDIDIEKKIAKDDPNFDFTKWEQLLQQQVTEASNRLKAQNIPHYVEFSGFRGYHLWVFFDEPTPASVAKDWMHHLFDDMPKVSPHFAWEIFPKQDKLQDNYGSLVKAPLHTHLKSGKATFFVDESFNPINGLPDIKTCKLDPVAVKAATEKTKHAPKSFSATKTKTGVSTPYPVPDNIAKLLANCAQLRDIVEKAEKTNHLDHDERIVLANLGRFFGKPGLDWIHTVLSHCRDYEQNTTAYHVSTLTGNPVHCSTVEKATKNKLCVGCRIKGNTPLYFGYTRISQHYHASNNLIKSLPSVIEKLGLKYNDKANKYVIGFNGHNYSINKQNGLWLIKFNIIDFIRFVRPEDWEVFLNENFPTVNANRFGVEFTEKSILEVFPFRGNIHTFKNYLSERDSEIETILTDDDNYNLIAFTGGGKTYALIKKIQDKQIKAIFLTPYESTAKQLESVYKTKSVYGTVSVDTVKDYVRNSDLICSTYDGLRKILETQIVPEDYVLLIDEAHNLITHSGFRYRALQIIFSNLDNFKKVINITGTPEGVLNNDYKNVKFVKQNQQSHISNYEIIESEEKSITTCVDHIINNPIQKGRVVIFKNSIKGLEVLRDALIERGVSTRKIKILHANEKESKLFESITDNETIPSGIQYVLTTSVISDGVNIVNHDIEAVYLLDVANLILLRQFVARFRKGIKNIYDIIPKAQKPEPKKWFDFPVELKRITALHEQIAEAKTKFLAECGLINSAADTNLLKNAIGDANKELGFFSMNESSDEVLVNYPALTLDLLDTFFSTGFLDVAKRKEYLDSFLNIATTTSQTQKTQTDVTTSRDRVKKRAEKNRKALIKLMNGGPKEVITTYLQKINPSLYHQIKNTVGDIFDPSVTTQQYYDKNKKLLKLKDSQKLIEHYLQFDKFDFPHDFIMELLAKPDNQIADFYLDYYSVLTLEMIEKHSTILKYNKKSLQVFNYAVMKFLYDYFKTTPEFDYDKLSQSLNSYLLSEKISGRKIDRTKLQDIVNRMVVKTRTKKRQGAKVKSVGWKFDRFKNIKDIVDPRREQVIRDSFSKYLSKKADFMKAALFINSLKTSSSSDSAAWKAVDELRKMCADLGSKE